MKVVLAGGGTAGHVNPAVAIASALKDEDEAVFFGTERGAEARIIPQRGQRLELIEVRGFDRSKPWTLAATGWVALQAVRHARSLLKTHDPDVVIGMGGYVSLPVCIAARTAKIPVVLHEQNIVFGLANRLAKPLAAAVAVSFEDTLGATGGKGVYTGNPVVPELVEADPATARAAAVKRFGLDPDRKTLLVFGGSQGARRINEAAAGLATGWSSLDAVQILHITGRDAFDRVNEEVGAAGAGGLVYRVLPYVDRMGEAYAVADVALCRGGATTVAELCVTGTPSVIVPYPYHRDKQQEKHGRVLERAGAAVVLDDALTDSASVAAAVEPLLHAPERLAAMRAAALELGRPDAAGHVVQMVREVAG